MRDGRTEPRRKEAYLKQYVDRLSGEPVGRSSVSAAVVEAFVNIAG
jgi:hypothetical protein